MKEYVLLGWDLPERVRKWNNKWYIKIFRFIGYLSAIIMMLINYLGLVLSIKEFFVLGYILITYCIYSVIILIIRIRHINELRKTGQLEIINSARLEWNEIAKGACVIIVGIGVIYIIIRYLSIREVPEFGLIGKNYNKIEIQLQNISRSLLDISLDRQRLLKMYPSQDEYNKGLIELSLKKLDREESYLNVKLEIILSKWLK